MMSLSCKKWNGDAANENSLTSEFKMKKRLTKASTDVKSVYFHLDAITACHVIEDASIFETFDEDTDEVKFPLEGLEITLP